MAWTAHVIPQRVDQLYAYEPVANGWGVDRAVARLQHTQVLHVQIETVGLESALGKVHSDETGGR